MLSRQTIDNSLSRAGRALRKGSDILKTLAYLLDPEGHPEPEEEPSRASYDPLEDDAPGYPVGASSVVIPPEAEQMISKPISIPSKLPDPPPLKGSIEARKSWSQDFDQVAREMGAGKLTPDQAADEMSKRRSQR